MAMMAMKLVKLMLVENGAASGTLPWVVLPMPLALAMCGGIVYYRVSDPSNFNALMFIFDSNLVWRMQLMIINGWKFALCV